MSGAESSGGTAGRVVETALRANVLGVAVNAINMEDTVRRCEELIDANGRGYICVTDVHSVIEARKDAALRGILNHSFLTTPDGMPLVWMGRIQGKKSMGRVYGPDLLIELCEVSVARCYRHFFLGGKPRVAETLAAKLSARFPGLQVAGTYAPPFRPLTDREADELIAQIEEAHPDVLWVGLGSPKQERFMKQYCDRFACKLMVGVGAAFDYHSGAVKEAPRWLHSTGLQWVHRVIQEPRRLWRRYLICVPSFLWMSGLQLTRLRRFGMET